MVVWGEEKGTIRWLLFLSSVALFPGPSDLSAEVRLGSHFDLTAIKSWFIIIYCTSE